MRHAFALLMAVLALSLAAAPAAAHHGKGSHARDSDDGGTESKAKGGFAACDWQRDPGSCPGNSGWAHWCKQHFGTGRARGQCVAQHAREQGVEVERDDGDDRGDLQITSVSVSENGLFHVRGRGSSGQVVIWVGAGGVVGFGQGRTNHEGGFDILGQWACHDDVARQALIRAGDADERASVLATFPCDREG